MKINMRSGNYDIIASGDVILFENSEELTIKITGENDFDICVTIKFVTEESGERRIDRDIVDDGLVLLCYNFTGSGTGTIKPIAIAQVNGRKVYLSFWAYLEGSKEPRTRSVKYTMYYER